MGHDSAPKADNMSAEHFIVDPVYEVEMFMHPLDMGYVNSHLAIMSIKSAYRPNAGEGWVRVETRHPLDDDFSSCPAVEDCLLISAAGHRTIIS